MKVFKFGGASVKDAAGVKNIVRVLQHKGFKDTLIVVSAMGKTTNALEQVVHSFFENKHKYPEDLKKVKENNFSVQELRDIIKHFHGKGITYKELRNKNKKSLEKILSNEIKQKFENTFWYR